MRSLFSSSLQYQWKLLPVNGTVQFLFPLWLSLLNINGIYEVVLPYFMGITCSSLSTCLLFYLAITSYSSDQDTFYSIWKSAIWCHSPSCLSCLTSIPNYTLTWSGCVLSMCSNTEVQSQMSCPRKRTTSLRNYLFDKKNPIHFLLEPWPVLYQPLLAQ